MVLNCFNDKYVKSTQTNAKNAGQTVFNSHVSLKFKNIFNKILYLTDAHTWFKRRMNKNQVAGCRNSIFNHWNGKTQFKNMNIWRGHYNM